jgi:hypothetical protein
MTPEEVQHLRLGTLLTRGEMPPNLVAIQLHTGDRRDYMRTRMLWLTSLLLLLLFAVQPASAASPEARRLPQPRASSPLGQLELLATSAVAGQDPGWTWQNPLPQGDILRAVWGSGPNEIFAVGAAGTILRYDGNQWSSMQSGTIDSLNGIWGSSGSDVFAVSNTGAILHYDGTAWATMPSGIEAPKLYGIWGSSSSDVFAVGYRGTILHYDGTAWAEAETGVNNILTAIWGSSWDNIFAVGETDYGTQGKSLPAVVLHYDGDTWNQVLGVPDQDLYGVWGSGPDDIFVVVSCQ